MVFHPASSHTLRNPSKPEISSKNNPKLFRNLSPQSPLSFSVLIYNPISAYLISLRIHRFCYFQQKEARGERERERETVEGKKKGASSRESLWDNIFKIFAVWYFGVFGWYFWFCAIRRDGSGRLLMDFSFLLMPINENPSPTKENRRKIVPNEFRNLSPQSTLLFSTPIYSTRLSNIFS